MLARIARTKPLCRHDTFLYSFLQSSQFSSSAQGEKKLNLFVSCLPGLESVLSSELSLLGIRHSPVPGGADLRQTSVETIVKCNLFCGSASHVLLRCGRAFYAPNFFEFSRKVELLPWNQYIHADTDVQVRATCSKSKIFHTKAIEERLIDSIDKALNRSNSQPLSGPTVQMKVRLHGDVAQISIDSYLTPLHERGYRFETSKAPLREDIAYSMLYAAHVTKFMGLLDPMCGAGTIAIEGAAMKVGLPPGRLRGPPMKGTQLFRPDIWDEHLQKALESSEELANSFMSKSLIMAGDRDEGAVEASKGNAERAGVDQFIDFSAKSISDHMWFNDEAPESVLLATNPPFGKRIAASRSKSADRFSQLLPLYQTLGKKIKGMKSQVASVVLTNNVDLPRKMGLKDTKALFSTLHGGLPVIAMGSNLIDPIVSGKLKFEVIKRIESLTPTAKDTKSDSIATEKVKIGKISMKRKEGLQNESK